MSIRKPIKQNKCKLTSSQQRTMLISRDKRNEEMKCIRKRISENSNPFSKLNQFMIENTQLNTILKNEFDDFKYYYPTRLEPFTFLLQGIKIDVHFLSFLCYLFHKETHDNNLSAKIQWLLMHLRSVLSLKVSVRDIIGMQIFSEQASFKSSDECWFNFYICINFDIRSLFGSIYITNSFSHKVVEQVRARDGSLLANFTQFLEEINS